MLRDRLWTLAALAAIDVLLGLSTDLIADAIGRLNAFAIAGALSLAIGVAFGRKVLDESAVPAGGRFGRRALLSVSMTGALGLFALTAASRPEEPARIVQAAPGTTSPSPSPVAEKLTLSQYLQKWRNGPVKLTVEHYNSWVARATDEDEVDQAVLDLRVGDDFTAASPANRFPPTSQNRPLSHHERVLPMEDLRSGAAPSLRHIVKGALNRPKESCQELSVIWPPAFASRQRRQTNSALDLDRLD